MRLTHLNKAVTAAFETNHPELGPLEVETTLDAIHRFVIICHATIHLTREQMTFLNFGVRDHRDIKPGMLIPNAIEEEFNKYWAYEEGPGAYGRSKETTQPIHLDGMDWYIGDGDDSLAVNIDMNTVRIWVRYWPHGVFGE